MLQETADRVFPGLIAPETLYVITSEQHVETVRRQLPDIPPQNVVGEPVGRDSAPAIGLMAALIEAQLGPETIMAVLASDHAIHDVAAFQNCLRAAAFEARSGYLVTLGIPPTSPDTGFGYIKRGDSLHTGSVPAFVAESFREKPSRIAAEEYVASGEYYWNAGMFIAQVSAFRALYQKFLPEMEPELKEMVAVFGTDHQTTAFARHFRACLKSRSITPSPKKRHPSRSFPRTSAGATSAHGSVSPSFSRAPARPASTAT